MKNMLTLLGLAVVIFLGLGYHLNWYTLSNKPAATDGHQTFEIDINAKKIGEDTQKGVKVAGEKIHDLIESSKK